MGQLFKRTYNIVSGVRAAIAAAFALGITAGFAPHPEETAVPVLTISDGVNTLSAVDGSPQDQNATAGAITIAGSLPSWPIVVVTALTDPALGTTNEPNLDVNAVASGQGSLTIVFSDEPFRPLSGNIVSWAGGTVAANGTITLSSFRSNILINTIGPFGAGSFSGSNGAAISETSPYSLSQRVTITHASVGTSSFDFEVKGSAALTTAPFVIVNPTNRHALLGSNTTFTVVAGGTPPLTYQWKRNGMNIAATAGTSLKSTFVGANTSTLTIGSPTVADSDSYSVEIRNAFGSVESKAAFLAVLGDGANGNQPLQVEIPFPAPKPTEKDSLIVITHGWQPLQPNADLGWMHTMSNSIQSRVGGNWQITNFVWLDQATSFYPEWVLYRALTKGRLLGRQLAAQGWHQVHFIGHSAGAGVIHNAASELPSTTLVQCTFLDPYVGLLRELQSVYGTLAAWSDCYFTQDHSAGWTAGGLPNAYNVDVDWLDPNREVYDFNGSPIALSTKVNAEGHSFPHTFYTMTVENSDPNWCAADFGFSLSIEKGGVAKWPSHQIGNTSLPVVVCGPANAIPGATIPSTFLAIVFNEVDHALSSLGTAISGAGAFLKKVLPFPSENLEQKGVGDTAAWLAVAVNVTNEINFIQFEASFTETNGGEGLLTIYWNTNQIGMLDERVLESGLEQFRFGLPETFRTGRYTLSFRLDAFAQRTSSVLITNLTVGFSGGRQPTLALSTTNGSPLLAVTGPTNSPVLIQRSTNLLNWEGMAFLFSTNGSARYTDKFQTLERSPMFYRALGP